MLKKIEKNKKYVLLVKNEEETVKLGRSLGSKLKKGDLVVLSGDLGAGKTMFTGGLTTSLGINRKNVSSPTYTIMKPYVDGIITVYHWDFYRIQEIEELYMADFFEILNDQSSILVIEWASMFEDAWYNYFPRYEVTIERGENHDERVFTIIHKSG